MDDDFRDREFDGKLPNDMHEIDEEDELADPDVDPEENDFDEDGDDDEEDDV